MFSKQLAGWVMAMGIAGVLACSGCDRDDSTPAAAGGSPAPASSTAATTATRTAATTTATTAVSRPAAIPRSFQDVTGPVKPDKVLAKVIQTLAVFNRP